jgi:hypothetical protein
VFGDWPFLFKTFFKERIFKMETKQLSIQEIIVKPEIQQRVNLNQDCVTEYAEEIANGAQFPPLVIFDDGQNLFLADGRHRYEAYKLAGVETVQVVVCEGGLRDAILYAVGANTEHGLRRTNADKRKAVLTLLTDKEWRLWSDAVIAKQCGVSQPFVSKLDRELTQNGFEPRPVRTGIDGRTTDTSNIGSKSQSSGDDQPHDPQSEQSNEPSTENSESEGQIEESVSQPSDDEDSVEDMNHPQEVVESQAEVSTLEEAATGSEDEDQFEESEANPDAESDAEAGFSDDSQDEEDTDHIEETDPLQLRIKELEGIIEAKDQRIKELELENAYLKRQIEEYAKQTIIPKPLDLEGTHLEERVS